ncbi:MULTISPECIES: ABC transporter permease [Metasolibacillus]|uniref:ABC transporter permease n=1 Tax=Metasolibacillus TaxID=2703677 RepID=UPI0007949187|nr:ABC transporter permease [Metasolibacillus fluoroglycofenilyticus]KYG91735.1 ABC transporter permease [[Bacillus] sp. KCTC 13219]
MRALAFAGRTAKEILRDPLTLIFGIGLPVVILLLLTAIGKNIPNDLFQIEQLTPGIAVFSLSFMSLFSAQLIANDRASSMLSRLFTTPMTAVDYIIGYTLPLIPMALAQGSICYGVAILLGMNASIEIIMAWLMLLPTSIIFIGIGLLCGSIFNEKAVAGICGGLLTNIVAWLSGTWFSLELVGNTFKTVAYKLPFVHAVDMGKAIISGMRSGITTNLSWVLGYGILLLIVAILVFKRKMQVD